MSSEHATEFDDGRYVYCLVRLDGTETATGSTNARRDATAAELQTTGIEDEPVSLLTLEGGPLAAVVHSCESVYDSADPLEVKRWLVRHQAVIDQAGERFGTPIPCQFDTIIRGGDDTVRRWMATHRDSLETALENLDGHWEYRVDVRQTEPVPTERLCSRDDDLETLRKRIEDASDGQAFLLEKQFDQRVRQRRTAHREQVTRTLRERLQSCTREVHELERQPSVSLDSGSVDGSDATTAPEDETNASETQLCRLTVLAHEDDEREIGSILATVDTKPTLEVRFTGPWPPYSFAPVFGEDGEPSSRRSHEERRPRTEESHP